MAAKAASDVLEKACVRWFSFSNLAPGIIHDHRQKQTDQQRDQQNQRKRNSPLPQRVFNPDCNMKDTQEKNNLLCSRHLWGVSF